MDGIGISHGDRRSPAVRVATIARAIADNVDALERDRRMPPALLEALHAQALFRMLLPKPFGGEETEPLQFMEAIEAIARIDASVAWCVCQGNGCAMTAAYLAPETSQKIWGEDPRAVLAWGPGPAEAIEAEGGYRVSGSLMFASGGRNATWLGAHCKVKSAEGEVRASANGAPDIQTCLMPADQIQMDDIWDVIGLRGTASDAYELKDVFVPLDLATRRDDAQGKVYDAPLYLFPSMTLFAMGFSSVALGIAQGFLADFLAFAQGKTPRLAKSTLASNPIAQSEMAQAAARIMAGRAFVRQEVADVWEETVEAGELSVASRARIRLASTFAIHEAKAAVDALYDLAGADAIFASKPFERRFRDIHTVTQQLQGRKSHFQTIGAWMMGKDADLSVM